MVHHLIWKKERTQISKLSVRQDIKLSQLLKQIMSATKAHHLKLSQSFVSFYYLDMGNYFCVE